jgi:hypothetical protein
VWALCSETADIPLKYTDSHDSAWREDRGMDVRVSVTSVSRPNSCPIVVTCVIFSVSEEAKSSCMSDGKRVGSRAMNEVGSKFVCVVVGIGV